MRRLLCLILICVISLGASAQKVYNSSGKPGGYKKPKQKGYDPERLVIGGGLNFGLANEYINLGISPKVGYKVLDFLAVGVGVGYQFYRAPDTFFFNGEPVMAKWNIISPSIWAKGIVYRSLFLSADFEYNIISKRGSTVMYDAQTNPYLVSVKRTMGVACQLVGAGLKQSLGGRTSATFELMYDVLQNPSSPYAGQIVYRAGIYVGL